MLWNMVTRQKSSVKSHQSMIAGFDCYGGLGLSNDRWRRWGCIRGHCQTKGQDNGYQQGSNNTKRECSIGRHMNLYSKARRFLFLNGKSLLKRNRQIIQHYQRCIGSDEFSCYEFVPLVQSSFANMQLMKAKLWGNVNRKVYGFLSMPS